MVRGHGRRSGGGEATVPDPLQLSEVDAERVIYDESRADYSTENPQQPRQPEASGPPTVAPYRAVSNPVLTASDVTDRNNVRFVADPFVVRDGGTFHMYLEVYHDDNSDSTYTGDVAHATSDDGITWSYDGVVLDEAHQLSYPHVFKDSGSWYMLPSAASSETVIYEADSLGSGNWTAAETWTNLNPLDPTPVRFGGEWFLFNYDNSTTPGKMRLYYKDNGELLGGSWTEHPDSPYSQTETQHKMGGRPVVHEDHVDVFYQDWSQNAGEGLRCFRVTELSKTAFSQQEYDTSPLLWSHENGGWNATGMHHVDHMMERQGGPGLVFVDGRDTNSNWAIGVWSYSDYRVTETRVSLDSSAQTTSSGSWEKVQFDTVEHQTGDYWDGSNYEFTVPESGYYYVKAGVVFKQSSGDYWIGVKVEGDDSPPPILYANDYANPNVAESVETSSVLYLPEGETIHVEARQDSGSNLDVNNYTGSEFVVRRVI